MLFFSSFLFLFASQSEALFTATWPPGLFEGLGFCTFCSDTVEWIQYFSTHPWENRDNKSWIVERITAERCDHFSWEKEEIRGRSNCILTLKKVVDEHLKDIHNHSIYGNEMDYCDAWFPDHACYANKVLDELTPLPASWIPGLGFCLYCKYVVGLAQNLTVSQPKMKNEKGWLIQEIIQTLCKDIPDPYMGIRSRTNCIYTARRVINEHLDDLNALKSPGEPMDHCDLWYDELGCYNN